MATEQNNNAQEGVDSGVSEDAFEQTPAQAQYQTIDEQEKWLKELTASRKERKHFDANATNALKRYRDVRSDSMKEARFYNIFFANTEIKMGALYAQLPKADIKRRNDDADDDVSRVAANLLQRNIDYELQVGNFDATFKQILFDRSVPGMGIGWMRLEEDYAPQQHALDPLTGAVIPLPPQVLHQEACIDYVAWDDFYWSPSKVWTLCPWVARRISMDKHAVEERFGKTADPMVLREMSYSTKPANESKADALHPQNQTEATVDVYEIWDKQRQLIFWISEGAEVPLDVQEDTNGFEGFFPTPMTPLARFDTSNTQPISDYQLVKGKYEELDDLNMRCANLQQAMGVRFVYDAANPDLETLYTSTKENQGVPIKNWAGFMGDKGGLTGSMQFAPLKEISDAFVGASTQLDRIKAQIYEVEGISDFVRGAATPYETATATSVKSAQSSGRFAVQQAEVAKYVEALLKLKAHLICRFYDPQIIMKRAGNIAQADQQYIPAAMQLLKDEQMSGFRLTVSVDSLQLPNWNTEKAERTELVHAVTSFLAEAMPGIQQMPAMAPFAMSLLKFAVAGYKGSKDIEGVIDQGLQQLMQSQAQQQGQSQGKPSPDEIKAQAAQAKTQADMQIASMQENTKQQIAQMADQREMAKLQLAAQQSAAEQDTHARDQQLREQELTLKAQHQRSTHAHDAAVDMLTLNKPQGGM